MLKRSGAYIIILILMFSVSVALANAKAGTCKNPSGGTYCNSKSQVSDCACDAACDNYGDCCSDYKQVCDVSTATAELVKEQVKCVFTDSTAEQSCYSEKWSCKGVGTCVVDVSGDKGEKVTWKSSCGGYAYTVIDGQSEHATFYCGVNATQIISEQVKCVFSGSNTTQSCYATNRDGKFYTFSGVGTAGGVVSGYRGETLTWKSSCSTDKLPITTMDGKAEYAAFDCGQQGVKCMDSDGGKDYYVKGFMKSGANDAGQWDFCYNDKQIVEYYCDVNGGAKSIYGCHSGCKDGACIRSACGNGVCDEREMAVNSLREGRTGTFTVGNKDYEVTLSALSDVGAQFVVNGQTTRKLKVGDKDFLADGTELKVTFIAYTDYQDYPIHYANFSINTCLQDCNCPNGRKDGKCVQGSAITKQDVISWVNVNCADLTIPPIPTTTQSAAAGKSTASAATGNSILDVFKSNKPQVKVTADITANGAGSIVTVPYNSSVKITWTSTNAKSCDVYRGTNIDKGNLVWSDTGNTRYATITSDTVFRLICTGPDGTASDEITVRPGNLQQCTDSDGGKDYYVKGFMKSGANDAGQWDFCYNDKQIVEYYCDVNGGAKSIYDCPSGCKDGACIKETSITKQDVISWVSSNCYDPPISSGGSSGGSSTQVPVAKTSTPVVTGNVVSKIFVNKQYWKD
ncbi:MAG TPA: hypothetical protein VJI52_05980 [Candidatus Nanoarchaeia archaeon]|nr:hypothetical protein [Candidatus Nanoarchaeia archaeon]